jgi:hypothetical protein
MPSLCSALCAGREAVDKRLWIQRLTEVQLLVAWRCADTARSKRSANGSLRRLGRQDPRRRRRWHACLISLSVILPIPLPRRPSGYVKLVMLTRASILRPAF